MKLFLKYRQKGLDFRCWRCGRIANAILGQKHGINAKKDSIPVFSNPYISIVCIDRSGVRQFNVDHIIPRCHMGPNRMINYRPSCMECNTTRGESMTEDEISFMGVLLGKEHLNKKVRFVESHYINVEFTKIKHNDWNLRVDKILKGVYG